jgi:hypothetical protein
MSDAEYLFRESIKEKKGMVSGAHHTSGKTRKNGTPRDLDVSVKEYKKKCGKVQKFSMNMPMKLEEFKSLPEDLQAEYLDRLLNVFHMSRDIISKMFGCSYPTVANIIKKSGVKYPNDRSTRYKKYYDDWRNFLNRDKRFSNIMESEDTVSEEVEVKKPLIISSTIQITATGYSDIAEQLLSYVDQDFPGDELIIRVIRR